MNKVIYPPLAKPNDLSERFIRGLKKYDLTLEEINSGKWTYAGGDGAFKSDFDERTLNPFSRHYKYYCLRFPEYDFPPYQEECVCEHKIVENCYIYSEDKGFVIIGNCCIKRFMNAEYAGRTCDKCKAVHRNTKYNLCNKCKPKKLKKTCTRCGIIHRCKTAKCADCRLIFCCFVLFKIHTFNCH